MEKSSPRFHHHQETRNYQTLLPSPNSTSSSSSSNSSSSPTSNGLHRHSTAAAPPPTPPSLPSPRPIARSDSANPYPTTFVQADTSSFKQVVQMLTGSPKCAAAAASPQPDPNHNHNHHHLVKSHSHAIPPIKSIPKRNQSSGFKLYERRNSLKNLKINPLNPFLAPPGSGFSPRKPEILSPSILDFPSLVLSPVTPLIHDPFDRSGSGGGAGFGACYAGSPMSGAPNHQNGGTPASKLSSNNSSMMVDSTAAAEEEKAIKEKGFYLHASPATTPREAEPPLLLPLFPVTSPRVSGSE
ncbi:VQ motif-containing protein 4 [Linum perenne]